MNNGKKGRVSSFFLFVIKLIGLNVHFIYRNNPQSVISFKPPTWKEGKPSTHRRAKHTRLSIARGVKSLNLKGELTSET